MPRVSTRALSGGLGGLAQAIMGGQDTFGQAAEQGAIGQSRISQAIAAMRDHEAGAKLKEAQTADVNAGLEMQTPENVQRNAMLGAGIPLDEEGAVSSFFQSGNLGGKYTTPADGVGPVAPEPEWKGKLGGIANRIMSMRDGLARGDKNSLNVAKAAGEYTNQDRIQQTLEGKMPASSFAQAIAASEGKPLVSAHEFGSVNNFTGAVDSSSPVAQRFGTYRDSETGKNVQQAGAAKANAAESYAGVGLKKAQADKARQDLEMGAKGVLQQTEQGLQLVDPRAGTSRPVIGPDGKPLQGKAGTLNEGQANALNFATRMQDANAIFDDLAKDGVVRPGLLKSVVQGAGNVIGLGGESGRAVGDAFGSAFHGTQSDKQQQVEQAQRNFINAVLRRESGAAIGAGEFANAKEQYFPQVGDSKTTIEQKRQNRLRVTQGILAAVPPNMRTLPNQGGASGGWDGSSGAPSAAGWKIEKVQ